MYDSEYLKNERLLKYNFVKTKIRSGARLEVKTNILFYVDNL